MEQDKEEWTETTRVSRRKSKRVKREHVALSPVIPEDNHGSEYLLLRQASSLLQAARKIPVSEKLLEADTELFGFETVSSTIMDELLAARRRVEAGSVVRNEHGHLVRPISRLEGDQLLEDILQKQHAMTATTSENILLRRLNQRGALERRHSLSTEQEPIVQALDPTAEAQPAPIEILDELYSIKTTAFSNSFASRIYGEHALPSTVFFQDWEIMSPWMELMADIMDHYRISHPEDGYEPYTWAPIVYTPIYAWHLPQIHDLLGRAFWPGIDVSDSVKWEPEQCSIVALYKKLVVGCAFLSETMDPYVTYITVRTGWEHSGIARFMLYHLIKANPNHDISLHVSATNPAMLLYNQFGFKAEEFVLGFYDDYLDDQAKLCKNALRMRYRR